MRRLTHKIAKVVTHGAVDVAEPDAQGEGKAILWAIGAKRDADGRLVADPESDFTLPLSGRTKDNAFILTEPIRISSCR